MTAALRTIVTFTTSRFNTSVNHDYFINEGCFGDDLAKWLIEKLARAGFQTADSPGQEDFGWYLTFTVDDEEHCFVVGYRPASNENGMWIGWLERSRSFVPSLFGARNRGILPQAANAIQNALMDERSIQDVRWHFKQDFEEGNESLGTTKPDGS
jgi:hypothetical protein